MLEKLSKIEWYFLGMFCIAKYFTDRKSMTCQIPLYLQIGRMYDYIPGDTFILDVLRFQDKRTEGNRPC